MALTDKLVAIAAAIREKAGTSEKLTLEEMPIAIAAIETGGGSGEIEIPEFSGDMSYCFANGHWSWLFENYYDEISIGSISKAQNMFQNAKVNKIPPMTQTSVANCSWAYAFDKSGAKEIGTIKYFSPSEMGNMFRDNYNLRELPEITNFESSTLNGQTWNGAAAVFTSCYSLRNIDSNFLKKIHCKATSSSYCHICGAFTRCYSLDEIIGFSPITGVLTSNMFYYSASGTFDNCSRVKRIVFNKTSEGEPYTVEWKNQTIDLYKAVGWLAVNDSYITDYNSGITIDKKVVDGETYQALKNDPDWYTGNVYFSRYNHTSAVETINSLPDASAYLATQSGGTNTIKFRQDAGELTDGGKVGNLTEEEIAVATAKGWAVVYAV